MEDKTVVSERRIETRRSNTMVLEGHSLLRLTRIVKDVEICEKTDEEGRKSYFEKELQIKKEDIMEFSLKEITIEELQALRAGIEPGFVYKDHNHFYFSKIKSGIKIFNFRTVGNQHLCAYPGFECKRLNALPDQLGGCAKVRNKSRWIEIYPWIIVGYETFNTRADAFVVIECEHNIPNA